MINKNNLASYLPIILVFIITILFVYGCSDINSPELEKPDSALNITDMQSDQYLRGGKWIHNVSGGGKDFYPDEDSKATFQITFNARKDAEGNVEGKVKWNFLDGTPASYGDVQCLEVIDNKAYMSYNAEGGEFGGYGTPGARVVLAFEDNGEGINAPLDRHSFIFYYIPIGLPENVDCLAVVDVINEDFGGFPVEWVNGNVQVR